MSDPTNDDPATELPDQASRRTFLRSSALVGTLGAGSLLAASAPAPAIASGEPDSNQTPFNPMDRAQKAYSFRVRAAAKQLAATANLPWQKNNRDDDRYADENFYASFTKTLPCDQFGEVHSWTFWRLRRALRSGQSSDFDRVPRDPLADLNLTNPQGGFRMALAGLDSHGTRVRPAPTFRSAESAAEMGEVYWQALTRDVPFSRFGVDAQIEAAIADLNGFSEAAGPLIDGSVRTETLFRGATPGDLTGPYLSQLLWKDVPYGPSIIEQRYQTPLAGHNFMTSSDNWLTVQRGGTTREALNLEGDRRYLHNNRALGEYVHRDVLFQAYFNAALILLDYGPDALSSSNPYIGAIANQDGFTTFGEPHILDLLTQAGNLGLAGAWYQKWRVHRRLRPEAYGGRVHHSLSGNRSYEIHPDLLNCAAVQNTFSANGSYFLPTAYPEGSPTHPAYPAGHATIAGACVTVLKAFFNESFVIPDPVEASDFGDTLNPYTGDDLTLGGECNKLASNIALGRDAAGVHYRSDGTGGLMIGEQLAIGLLLDNSYAMNEAFNGFQLTKFDGSRILIRDGETRLV